MIKGGVMLHWTILQGQTYEALRWTMITLFEGVEYRPYLDSVGWVTIGVGFKIQQASDPYQGWTFDALGLAADCPQRAALQQLFDHFSQAVQKHAMTPQQATDGLRPQADALVAQALGEGHAFTLSEDAAKGLFAHGAPRYENEVDQWETAIPQSRERLALFSLAWNGVLADSPSLKRAIAAGQRSEGWFQIRYNSNGGAARCQGIAARRACEGSLFGLYDTADSVSSSEAQAVMGTVEQHRSHIDGEEKAFPKAVELALSDYAPLLPALPMKTVPTLEQALAPAQQVYV
jgi:GH24 family phage-related lysozyme (muramidase)